jgi:mRNA interferase HigB
MKLVGKGKLVDFKQIHTDACSQIDSWVAEVESANWKDWADVKRRFGTASSLPQRHLVFNIKGNKYRLRVQVSYQNQIVSIDKVGTHDEYMKWRKIL